MMIPFLKDMLLCYVGLLVINDNGYDNGDEYDGDNTNDEAGIVRWQRTPW